MEQKLSDTLVKVIDRSNPMMQNLQLASRFNKLVDEGGGGGGEDKLLCYKIHVGDNYTYVVYTDKSATKIQAGEIGGFEESILPVDEGKHLFITDSVLVETTVDYAFSYLVYEDGSPSEDLKGKFVAVS